MSVSTETASLSMRQIHLIVAGLALGMFLAALDLTKVSTAIRTIGDDLQGLTAQAWVITAYMIASTLATPVYGKLSDIYGRKPLYIVSISLFMTGSILSGLASSMVELAAFRAVQGLGGGGLMALALIILGDILTPRERTKYQAAFFAVWAVASVVGPVVGGLLAGLDSLMGITGWRWIFFINLPLAMFALWVVVRVLNVPTHTRKARVDYRGLFTLMVAIIPLLIVVEQGHSWGWTSPLVLGLAALSVTGSVAFVAAERQAGDDALLPLRMFTNRTFAVATILNFIMGFAMFGGLAGLPLYLQIGKGLTPTAAGLAMLPFTLGITVMAMVSSSVIRRTGRYTWAPRLGTALLIVAGLALSTVEASTPLWELSIYTTLFGAGLGCIMQPVLLAVQNAVNPRDMGTGSASVMFFRQIGGSLGTAVFLSLLFSSVSHDIVREYDDVVNTPEFQEVITDPAVTDQPLNAAVLNLLRSGSFDRAEELGLSLDDTSFVQELNPVLAAPFQEGFSQAIGRELLWSTAFVLLAFLVSWALPAIPLREKSGIQSIADEDDELTARA